MDQTKILLSIQCPEHQSQLIGSLDLDPNAQKIGYCYECMIESQAQNTFPKKLTTPAKFLQETSDFYQNLRQSVTPGEPPVEYVDELSKKAERLEKLSKHIETEKSKVKQRFDEVRESILQIIGLKEEECLKLLENEISSLSDAYTQYEKLLTTGWLKPSDIDSVYPTADVLEQRIAKLADLDQLQAFMKGVAEDMKRENQYSDGPRIYRVNHLMKNFQTLESSLPELQGKFLSPEGLESLKGEILAEFNAQELKVENSIAQKMKESVCGSAIIDDVQYGILKNWLSEYKNLSLRLLYRGSVDGMSAKVFHEKCDEKGATVTLIKCHFDTINTNISGNWGNSNNNSASEAVKKAVSFQVIGGFLDQSWQSSGLWGASDEAFLFSLTRGSPPVKCEISSFEKGHAYYRGVNYGPIFGAGPDLDIGKDFKRGKIWAKSFKNLTALYQNDLREFTIEEIEVFQVQHYDTLL